jgi:hypothetical protein
MGRGGKVEHSFLANNSCNYLAVSAALSVGRVNSLVYSEIRLEGLTIEKPCIFY